ncbi:hypothetical protein F4859DRAFT_504245 [Xylaria cf. heliscus]|nr:hypothetical protein F4859DRAFT_504245 [Xylaria cf. heliscus]
MAYDSPPRCPQAAAYDSPFQTRIFQFLSPLPVNQSRPSLATTPPKCTTVSSGEFIWEHFPVSFRTGNFDEHIKVIGAGTFSQFLEVEFSLKRLDDIDSKLWCVGYPRPPRPLSTQAQMGRTIVLTNALDMHLVWGDGKIFLKPLPRYLLEPEFWANYLPSGSALGLLYTYACLITHPTDLMLAIELGLIPKENGNGPDWGLWRKLAVELLDGNISHQMHRRFRRSELRLHRLNWIYIFKDLPFSSMYDNPWHTFTDFFTFNLSWVTTATVYIAIVLTAMQVGLATDMLKDNTAFQRASYGFTVFAILGPLAACLLLVFALLLAVIPNWISARLASSEGESTPRSMTSVKVT